MRSTGEVVEVLLNGAAVGERDLAAERSREPVDHRARDLLLEAVDVDRLADVDRRDHLVDLELAVGQRDLGDHRDPGIVPLPHRDAAGVADGERRAPVRELRDAFEHDARTRPSARASQGGRRPDLGSAACANSSMNDSVANVFALAYGARQKPTGIATSSRCQSHELVRDRVGNVRHAVAGQRVDAVFAPGTEWPAPRSTSRPSSA